MFKILAKNEYYRQSQRLLLCTKLDSGIVHCYRCKSHYKSLGLNSDASPKEIKSAYYDLSLKFHPDKNKGSAESVEKFREISEAYEVLGNTEKKRVYDGDLNSGYSESDWRRENYSPRSDTFRSRSRYGRTEHYNYDEHYRKHYEEYYRQREMDYEDLRRRWEAEFRRRYPFADEEDFKKYRRDGQRHAEPHRIKLLQSRSFIYIITFWLILFVFSLPIMEEAPKTFSKPIYYKVNSDDKESHDKKEF